jgi:hypothetical protein
VTPVEVFKGTQAVIFRKREQNCQKQRNGVMQ